MVKWDQMSGTPVHPRASTPPPHQVTQMEREAGNRGDYPPNPSDAELRPRGTAGGPSVPAPSTLAPTHSVLRNLNISDSLTRAGH